MQRETPQALETGHGHAIRELVLIVRTLAKRSRMVLVALCLFFAINARAESKRERQDYFGPKQNQTKAALLWVPRVLLFPPWLVSEYVLRQPMGALVRSAERDQWPAAVIHFFTFGERDQVTLFPSALFDFGLKPSVGFNLSWKYFLAESNTLNVHAGTWGLDWLALRVRDRYELAATEALSLDARLVSRKDLPFYGVGPLSPNSPRFRYQALTTELALGYERGFWRSSMLSTQLGIRTLSFGDGTCCGASSVIDAVQGGQIPAPPGLDEGYVAEFQGVSVAVDSREAAPANGSGIRLEIHEQAVFAPARGVSPRRAWVSYGASSGLALDLWQRRIVGLNVSADLGTPLAGAIPFTDQVTLGGSRPMRGYLQGRLIDRSSIVATLQYTWPIWVYLDGVVQTDVGNVFGPQLDGFDVSLLRLSSSVGFRSNGSPDSGLELLVAAATDPFQEGFHVSSFRLVLGSHHGF